MLPRLLRYRLLVDAEERFPRNAVQDVHPSGLTSRSAVRSHNADASRLIATIRGYRPIPLPVLHD
jgi:hypothetical protein